jgi:hypothetical protein
MEAKEFSEIEMKLSTYKDHANHFSQEYVEKLVIESFPEAREIDGLSTVKKKYRDFARQNKEKVKKYIIMVARRSRGSGIW